MRYAARELEMLADEERGGRTERYRIRACPYENRHVGMKSLALVGQTLGSGRRDGDSVLGDLDADSVQLIDAISANKSGNQRSMTFVIGTMLDAFGTACTSEWKISRNSPHVWPGFQIRHEDEFT